MNITYDSRNRVVRRTSPNGTLNLTYSGWNLIEERNGGGDLEQTYVHGAGVDEMLVKISSSGPAYCHHDGLGSTIALTGENGTLLESYRYDAFGGVGVMNASGFSLQVSGFQNRFLFTGREWLGQAGIYDYRNRVYSAQIGRFLQTDPIRFEGGDINIYRYVGNNPINLADPLGLWGIGWGDGQGNVSWNIGVGDPTLLFTPDSGMDVSMAAAATLDGINPFGDPLADMGAYDPCDPAFQFSQGAGAFSRDVYTGRLLLGGLARFAGTRLGNQLLNSNRYLRIGPGRMPANGRFPASPKAPRISIGRGPGNPHIDLRP